MTDFRIPAWTDGTQMQVLDMDEKLLGAGKLSGWSQDPSGTSYRFDSGQTVVVPGDHLVVVGSSTYRVRFVNPQRS